MARSKTTTAAPPIGEHPPGIEPHLRRLDRQRTQWQQEQSEAIDELKQVWAPRVTKARALIAELESLATAYGPTL
jgi:hypothetical protein